MIRFPGQIPFEMEGLKLFPYDHWEIVCVYNRKESFDRIVTGYSVIDMSLTRAMGWGAYRELTQVSRQTWNPYRV